MYDVRLNNLLEENGNLEAQKAKLQITISDICTQKSEDTMFLDQSIKLVQETESLIKESEVLQRQAKGQNQSATAMRPKLEQQGRHLHISVSKLEAIYDCLSSYRSEKQKRQYIKNELRSLVQEASSLSQDTPQGTSNSTNIINSIEFGDV